MMEEKPRYGTAQGKVSSMSAQQGGSQPDLYEVLGIGRDASREEVARAWRRRARAEHPDSRPNDPAAPARFRVLAEAYNVLADPGRRAAYDRASGYRPPSVGPADAPGRLPGGRGQGSGGAAVSRAAGAPGASLRAGPVWIEPLPQAPAGGPPVDEDDVLAELVLRYLARRWPW